MQVPTAPFRSVRVGTCHKVISIGSKASRCSSFYVDQPSSQCEPIRPITPRSSGQRSPRPTADFFNKSRLKKRSGPRVFHEWRQWLRKPTIGYRVLRPQRGHHDLSLATLAQMAGLWMRQRKRRPKTENPSDGIDAEDPARKWWARRSCGASNAEKPKSGRLRCQAGVGFRAVSYWKLIGRRSSSAGWTELVRPDHRRGRAGGRTDDRLLQSPNQRSALDPPCR